MRPVVSLLALSAAIWCAPAAARSRTVWDGVYTDAQAVRGRTLYADTCARCHGDTFLGADDAPPLAGDEFLKRWDGKPLFRMFDTIRRKMPSDGPAVLSRAESADVVAYLLSVNHVPSAAADLPADDAALNEILITTKP